MWQRLNADLTAARGPDWMKKKIAIYGAGGLGLSFMQTFPQLSIAYAIDSDPTRRGEVFHGLPVHTPDVLETENLDDLIVFTTSSWHQEIRLTLESLGLEMNRNFFFGNQQAHGRIFFYLREMADFSDAFSWFEKRGTEYSILRWFETLPEDEPADIDLLVRSDDLPDFFENPYLKGDPGGVPLEVYWSRPLGQEDELLYYPTWLACEILASRYRLASGAFAPDEDRYLKSLAYHVVFHKAERAKWPTTASDPAVARPNKYFSKIQELSTKAGLNLEFTLEGMWSYLDEVGWLPPIDLARRYAVDLKSPWLIQKVGPLAGANEDVLVFVFREWLLRHSAVFDQVVRELERLGLQQIEIVKLVHAEKEVARERIRGGNWVETSQSREGGGPAAFAVFLDPSPERPSEAGKLLRPFCANRKLGEKTDLKQRICKDYNEGEVVNFLHAADDEREGLEYVECLAPDRLEGLLAKIARARQVS